jgi:hypothetical protein
MKSVALIAGLFIVVGCGSSATESTTAPTADQEGRTVAENHGPYSVTEVRIGADGRAESTVYSMTQAQSVARAGLGADGLKTQSIEHVPCSNSSVHLYDATLITCQYAGCNELCFEVTDPNTPVDSSVYFGNYCVTPACTYSWNSMVRSYWTGDRPARLHRNYSGYAQCDETLGDRWSYKDAQWCGQNSDFLIIPKL